MMHGHRNLKLPGVGACPDPYFPRRGSTDGFLYGDGKGPKEPFLNA